MERNNDQAKWLAGFPVYRWQLGPINDVAPLSSARRTERDKSVGPHQMGMIGPNLTRDMKTLQGRKKVFFLY